MKCFLQNTILFATLIVIASKIPDFHSDETKPASNLLGLNFVSRVYIPYGPSLDNDSSKFAYSFAMGTLDEMAYDEKEHFLYTLGEIVGNMFIVDYENPSNPRVLEDFYLDFSDHGKISGIKVCPAQAFLFVTLEDNSSVLIYETVKRSSIKKPTLKKTIDVESLPGVVLPNDDCSIIAIAHENDGKGLSRGSVTIIRNPLNPQVTNIPLDANDEWNDDYVLRKGLNMPLTLNALKYWDDYSAMANDIDFSEIRNNYRTSIFLLPESLAWAGPDQKELLVNLQINNGLLRIDVNTNKILDVAGYGLKSHDEIPVDINGRDRDCNLKTYQNLFSMRAPDDISTARYNDKIYVFSGNEGDNFGYDEYEDSIQTSALFQGSGFGLSNIDISKRIFDPEFPFAGTAALFNGNCEGADCVERTVVTLGSTSIDYENDPSNPIFQRMVMLGGRGWSIFELPENPSSLLKIVYDSAETVEDGGCRHFPWAHNAVQGGAYAPADNLPNNTAFLLGDEETREELLAMNDPNQEGCLDQGDSTPGACPMQFTVDTESEGFGPAPGALVIGEACGRLVAVTVTKRSSVAFLYDITDVTTPDLIKVFHLSEVSRTKSPGLAYNEGTLGELSTLQLVFLAASESPSGKPSVIFGGEDSGTVSFWEFDCSDHNEGAEGATITSAVGTSSLILSFFMVPISILFL